MGKQSDRGGASAATNTAVKPKAGASMSKHSERVGLTASMDAAAKLPMCKQAQRVEASTAVNAAVSLPVCKQSERVGANTAATTAAGMCMRNQSVRLGTPMEEEAALMAVADVAAEAGAAGVKRVNAAGGGAAAQGDGGTVGPA